MRISSRAFRLAERRGFERTDGRGEGPAGDRLRWWAESVFGGSRQGLNFWLRRACGVGAREALRLVELNELQPLPPEAPAWCQVLSEAFSSEEWQKLAADEPARQKLAAGLGLNCVFHPFTLWARSNVERAVRRLAAAGIALDEEGVVESALGYLGQRLTSMASPSVVLAMNMARKADKLTGDSPQSRAFDFAVQLLDHDLRARHLAPMPVLDRRLAQLTGGIVAATEELIDRLIANRSKIYSQFGLDGRLLEINLGLGDAHKELRTVSEIRCENGKVIYKPRSMAVDVAFRELTLWVNERMDLTLPVQNVLDCGDHGWVEVIEGRECESHSDAQLGHRRMGGMLALLHLCGANDVHYENLIFDGANPQVVDLETLLTPFARLNSRERSHGRARHNSILRVGYLPTPAMYEGDKPDDRRFFDFSGVGRRSDTESAPLAIPSLNGFERDDAEVALKRNTMPPTLNHPRVSGKNLPALEFIDEIQAGFSEAYAALLAHKADLVAPGGPLSRFAHTEIRWVARATLEYAKALHNTYHPSSMRDGADHDVSAARILYPPPELPYLGKILQSELLDLWQGDVPYFSVRSNSKTLRDSRGKAYHGFFSESGYEAMLRNARQLSRDDLAAQQSRIRMSLRAATMSGGPLQPEQPFEAKSQRPVSDEDLIQECVRIGDRLIRDAIRLDDVAYWVGISTIGKENYKADLAGPDVYHGSGGIGIFLGELYRVTGLERFRNLAENCLASVSAATSKSRDPLGAFEGVGALVYAHLRISELIGQTPSVEELEDRLTAIRSGAPWDNNLDVIAGSAGAALAALAATRVADVADLALDAALQCGRRLQETVIHSPQGASWNCATVDQALAGFSHGTSGIAYALAAIAAASGKSEFAEIAWEALRFESSVYVAEHGWRDLRWEEGSFPHTWCHGSAGITLARLKIRELGVPGAPDLSADIAAGIDALLRNGMGGSHCLCHGTLGNVEPLLRVGGVYADVARAAVSDAVNVAREEGRFRCGVAEFEETPGLLNGTSGVGLGLLRAVDPSIPSALLVEHEPARTMPSFAVLEPIAAT